MNNDSDFVTPLRLVSELIRPIEDTLSEKVLERQTAARRLREERSAMVADDDDPSGIQQWILYCFSRSHLLAAVLMLVSWAITLAQSGGVVQIHTVIPVAVQLLTALVALICSNSSLDGGVAKHGTASSHDKNTDDDEEEDDAQHHHHTDDAAVLAAQRAAAQQQQQNDALSNTPKPLQFSFGSSSSRVNTNNTKANNKAPQQQRLRKLLKSIRRAVDPASNSHIRVFLCAFFAMLLAAACTVGRSFRSAPLALIDCAVMCLLGLQSGGSACLGLVLPALAIIITVNAFRFGAGRGNSALDPLLSAVFPTFYDTIFGPELVAGILSNVAELFSLAAMCSLDVSAPSIVASSPHQNSSATTSVAAAAGLSFGSVASATATVPGAAALPTVARNHMLCDAAPIFDTARAAILRCVRMRPSQQQHQQNATSSSHRRLSAQQQQHHLLSFMSSPVTTSSAGAAAGAASEQQQDITQEQNLRAAEVEASLAIGSLGDSETRVTTMLRTLASAVGTAAATTTPSVVARLNERGSALIERVLSLNNGTKTHAQLRAEREQMARATFEQETNLLAQQQQDRKLMASKLNSAAVATANNSTNQQQHSSSAFHQHLAQQQQQQQNQQQSQHQNLYSNVATPVSAQAPAAFASNSQSGGGAVYPTSSTRSSTPESSVNLHVPEGSTGGDDRAMFPSTPLPMPGGATGTSGETTSGGTASAAALLALAAGAAAVSSSSASPAASQEASLKSPVTVTQQQQMPAASTTVNTTSAAVEATATGIRGVVAYIFVGTSNRAFADRLRREITGSNSNSGGGGHLHMLTITRRALFAIASWNVESPCPDPELHAVRFATTSIDFDATAAAAGGGGDDFAHPGGRGGGRGGGGRGGGGGRVSLHPSLRHGQFTMSSDDFSIFGAALAGSASFLRDNVVDPENARGGGNSGGSCEETNKLKHMLIAAVEQRRWLFSDGIACAPCVKARMRLEPIDVVSSRGFLIDTLFDPPPEIPKWMLPSKDNDDDDDFVGQQQQKQQQGGGLVKTVVFAIDSENDPKMSNAQQAVVDAYVAVAAGQRERASYILDRVPNDPAARRLRAGIRV